MSLMKTANRISFFFARLIHFEYWPFWFFYIPMYFYGIYLAIRSGSFMYFSTTNPGMKYSGVMGESKYKVLMTIPAKYRPKTIFIPSSTPYHSILDQIKDHGFQFPFVIKPDVGERGKDIEKIEDEGGLKDYLRNKSFDLNIQEFIELEMEFGVLYHRMPGDKAGSITSLTQKGFLSVTGNGKKTLLELMDEEIRIANRLDYFKNKFADQLDHILPEGRKMLLEPIGNHSRGTTFYNANHLINDQLHQTFDAIASQIDGYYYGRFDLKVNLFEDLYVGNNIKIIELNGVSSEVAHIYDPKYKLTQAYKDVFRHMKYIYLIAKRNHKNGLPYDSLWQFMKDLRFHLKS